ncbi:MAG TPA: GtrA family protein [Gaiellaceae bacterium]|nr:GtrA family protein [Gaiellaceae bacterium]
MDRAFVAAGLALRARHNWIQLAKFCVVGGVGYAVNLGVYSLLLNWANLNYLIAAVGSFAVAVTNNYLLNRYWTFHRERGHFAYQGARFFLVSVASLGANLLILHLLISAGFGKIIGQAIAIILVTPLNFIGNKLWSFRR